MKTAISSIAVLLQSAETAEIVVLPIPATPGISNTCGMMNARKHSETDEPAEVTEMFKIPIWPFSYFSNFLNG